MFSIIHPYHQHHTQPPPPQPPQPPQPPRWNLLTPFLGATSGRLVQILDLPVPQTVDYVADAFRLLDRPMAEQVIEVPKIFCSPCPSRSLVPEPHSAEQLVEVPAVLSLLRIAEQIVDTPVPRGRGQGSLPGQSTTATHSSVERISERIVAER